MHREGNALFGPAVDLHGTEAQSQGEALRGFAKVEHCAEQRWISMAGRRLGNEMRVRPRRAKETLGIEVRGQSEVRNGKVPQGTCIT